MPQHASGRRSFINLPSVRALLMQILSLLLVVPCAVALAYVGRYPVPLYAVVLAQGVVAALLSRLIGLAAWWLLIQFAFVPLLYAAAALALPSGVYLAGFLLLLVLYWSAYRTQVPYYPSGPAGWRAVAAVLPFYFDTLGLHRLHAAFLPHNIASRRVLEKNGFVEEGYAEKYLQIDGKWADHVLFALTRERWDARVKPAGR